MQWRGQKIKELARKNRLPLAKLSEMTGVTRQTVNGWIKGQIPKGNHLIAICKIFNVSPDYFFTENDGSITAPAHRTRRKIVVTSEIQGDALNIAKEYAFLFRNETDSSVVPVIRVYNRNIEAAKKIAHELRIRSEVTHDSPLFYSHAFKLMKNLGIKVIFREFPGELKKVYAFFTKIFGHRVVFVNSNINVLDLIFQLIHEAVHAVRDEVTVTDTYDTQEEEFCDDVANHVQFPDVYVNLVYNTIKDMKTPIQINKLKNFGGTYKHSLYGLVKRINSVDPSFALNVGGADTNLKKKYGKLSDVLFSDKNPRQLLENYRQLSPLFFNILKNQRDTITTRKLGEILDINTFLDSAEIKNELEKMRNIAD